jgi:hypothetical protein
VTYAGLSPLLVAAIPPLMPGVRVATRTPADLQDVVPFIRLWDMGGPSNVNVTDIKELSLEADYFAADEPGAIALGVAFEKALHSLTGTAAGGATILRVLTQTNVSYRPWLDTTVSRKGGNFRVWIFTR